MIREYIQYIITESIEEKNAKQIELLKKMLQTSYYNIQTGKNIDINEKKYEYANNVLTRKHNFTPHDIDTILDPIRYRLKCEARARKKKERARKKKEAMEFEQRSDREAKERAERWSQNAPEHAPRQKRELPSTKHVMDTIDKQRQGYRWSDVYQDWIK